MDGVQGPARAGREDRAALARGSRSVPASVPAPASIDAPSLRVQRSFDELGELATRWDELQHHPWSDREHFQAVTASEPGFLRPHVLAVAEPGRAPGLCVASLNDEVLRWKVGGLTLARTRARVLRVPTGGLLALATGARVRLVAEALRASLASGEADAVYLHEVDKDEPLLAELTRLRDPGRDPAPRLSNGWTIALPPSFAEFRGALPGKARSNLNHAANVAHKRLGGEPRLCVYREPAELDTLARDCERVARATYHRRAGVGFVDCPATRRFLAHALARGWLRVHVLYVGERPIAFEQGLCYRGTYFGRHTGFDPEFAEARPGVYLVVKVIERLCDERVAQRLDLGSMDTQLKRTLGGLPQERVSLYCFAQRPRGAWLRASRAAVGWIERGTRAALGGKLARKLRRALPG